VSGSTTELALSTAVDGDDNADYLTLDLANSLRTLDALFSNVTGHNHGAAHQGGTIANIPASALADGIITSAKIADGAIQTQDLADSSVTSIKIADGTIVTGDLADASVTSAKIVDGTIQTVDLADGIVTSIKIADGTIQGVDIAAGTITYDKIATFAQGPHTTDWFRCDTATNGLYNMANSQGIAFNAQGALLYPANDPIVGTVATQTLQNKNLTPTNCSVGGYQIVGTASGLGPVAHIESGVVVVSTPAGSGGNFGGVGAATVTFARAFTANPIVVITWDDQGAPGDVSNYAHGVSIASTTQFVARAQTNQTSAQSVRLVWIAFGV